MKVKIKPERDNFEFPIKATEHAACFDVYASKIESLELNKVVVYLGFSLDIEIGYKALLVPRSSLTKEHWVMLNSPGQIDPDFRGELQMRFTAIPSNGFGESEFIDTIPKFPYKVGERIGQMYFEKIEEPEWELVSETTDTVRGSGSFGHTGK